jgi:hypothetical protein
MIEAVWFSFVFRGGGGEQKENYLKKLKLTSDTLFYEQISQTTWNESNGELYFYEYVCLSVFLSVHVFNLRIFSAYFDQIWSTATES